MNSNRKSDRVLRYCKKCSEYTMEEKCPRCGEKTVKPEPPRFSPLDKFGKYRRMMKSG